MGLNLEELRRLEAKANELRHVTVDTVLNAGSGHIGGKRARMRVTAQKLAENPWL